MAIAIYNGLDPLARLMSLSPYLRCICLAVLLPATIASAAAQDAVRGGGEDLRPAVGGPYRSRLQTGLDYRDLGGESGVRHLVIFRGDYAFHPDGALRIDVPVAGEDGQRFAFASNPELSDILVKGTWRPLNTPDYAVYVAMAFYLEADTGYRLRSNLNQIAPEAAVQFPLGGATVLEAGARYFRSLDFGGGDSLRLWRPRLQLASRWGDGWAGEMRAQFFLDARSGDPRNDDTLILELEATRDVARNWQAWLNAGQRIYGNQGYQWGWELGLRYLFR